MFFPLHDQKGRRGTTFTCTPAVGENNSLTIVGSGAGSTILDGGNNNQVQRIETFGLVDDSDGHITINNLTIQNITIIQLMMVVVFLY